MVRDGWWMVLEFGIEPVAQVWRGVHRSAAANPFWSHRWIDPSETGRDDLEAGVAMGNLVIAGAYYRFSDRTILE